MELGHDGEQPVGSVHGRVLVVAATQHTHIHTQQLFSANDRVYMVLIMPRLALLVRVRYAAKHSHLSSRCWNASLSTLDTFQA